MKITENQSAEVNWLIRLLMSFTYSRIHIIVTLIAIVLTGFYIAIPKSSEIFNTFLEPTITVLTFIIVTVLGINNLFTNWINSLEKRLTVFFVYYYESINECRKGINQKNENAVNQEINFIEKNSLSEKTPYCLMVCEEAFLPHEGDIRNLAQQLGRQFESDNLSFYPFITLGDNNKVIRKVINGRKFFTKQYTVFMFLSKIPKCVIDSDSGLLATDNYDDTPNNKKKPFKISTINYQLHKDYFAAKKFIETIGSEVLTENNLK